MLVLIGLFIIPGCFGIDSFVCNPNCVAVMANGTDHCNSTTGECLYGCQPGQAGRNCSFVCPSNCELHAANETETCNATNGECLYGCKQGYAGPNCSVECPQTCAASNIRGTTICNATSEACLFGCQDGHYGARCENKCDDIIRNCKRCSLQSDNSVICDECIMNFYRNSRKCTQCNYWCITNASSPLPNCREIDGYCNDGCTAGRYGLKCDIRCSSTCKDICDRDLGHCQIGCNPTSYCGSTCQLVCSDGCVSSDCEQSSCSCRRGCTQKKWGETCDKLCSVNCNEPPDLNSNICERSNGTCSYKCKNDTFWGSQCEQKCNNNCVNGTCERYDGYCNSGCVAGSYGDQCHLNCHGNCLNLKCHRTTAYCEAGCVAGNYGDQCEKECSLTCLKRSCDRNTGTCVIGCGAGWYGDQCNKPCSDNCLNFICKREDGACTYGYLDGEGGSVSNSKLVAGLVSGWLLSLVLIVILCIIAIRRYHLCRVCGDKKKLKDVQSEIAAHDHRVQHEYMTLQHGPSFTNSETSYDTLKTDEESKDVQGIKSTYENVEASTVNG